MGVQECPWISELHTTTYLAWLYPTIITKFQKFLLASFIRWFKRLELYVDSYLVTRLERLSATAARKTLLVVSVAHRLHYFAFNVQFAGGTLCTVQLLIVGRTIICIVFGKETASGQRFVTRCALEAGLVEVFVGDAQHFAGTFLRALGAINFCFTCTTETSQNQLYIYFNKISLKLYIYFIFAIRLINIFFITVAYIWNSI